MDFYSFMNRQNGGCVAEDESLSGGKTLQEHDRQFHPQGYQEGDTCKFRDKLKIETVPDDLSLKSVRKIDSGYSVEVGGKSVGFMTLTHGYGDSIANEIVESTGEYNLRRIDPNAKSVYIEDLGVSREYRGKGYAKQMMDKLLHDYGDKQLILRAFDPGGESDQDRLVDFYKGYGFQPIAETESDGVIMVRSPAEYVRNDGGIANNREYSSGCSHVTPEEDAAYMDAVKKGNMKTAERMVREAAAKAMPNAVLDDDGLPKIVYHGTNKKFVKFDKSMQGYDPGFFFAENRTRPKEGWTKEYAEYYGGNIILAFIQNADRLSRGEYRVNEPKDIKSANPVTYDDNGNAIPLSQRFNFDSPDIRY